MKEKLISISLILTSALCFSSCATIFTSSHQDVVFAGESDATIYDGSRKLGKLDADGVATIKLRKGLNSKHLYIKKDGYERTYVSVVPTFNLVSLLNILFWPGFIVDVATGKICKYDDEVIEFEMQKKDQ